MSTTHTGDASAVSLTSAVSITEPADGDARNAASVNVALSKLADYMEALRARENRFRVETLFAEPSGAASGSRQFYGDFGITWTGANAPALQAYSTTVDGPYVQVDAPANGNVSTIFAGTTAGLCRISSFFEGSIECYVNLSAVGANSVTFFFGLAANVGTNFTGCAFTMASGESTWQCKTNDGATTSTTDSTIGASTGAFTRLRIDITGSGTGTGLAAKFYTDGILRATKTTNIPTGSTINPIIALTGTGANTTKLNIARPRFIWTQASGA